MIIERKLGPKGQIVIPKVIRDMLGVKPGDVIYLEIRNNEVIIKQKPSPEDFLEKFYKTSKKLNNKINIEEILDKEYLDETN
ncbi:MAG: AbrB/MazE/SpoVT family DNA-binding domain-containing protein [Candidatus Helarchaeota archaeon]